MMRAIPSSVLSLMLSFLILSVPASALEITSFDADYSIAGQDTRTIYTIKFVADGKENFSIEIPSDSEVNSVSVDDLFVDQLEREQDTKKTIMFPINASGKAIIDFTTSAYVDTGRKNYFVADIKAKYSVGKLQSRVSLPQSSFLGVSKEDGGSVFPDGDVKTDGRVIYVEWKKDALSVGNSFPMFVIYKTGRGQNMIVYVFAAILLAVAGYIVFRHRQKERQAAKTIVKEKSAVDKKTGEEKTVQEDDEGGQKSKKLGDIQQILSHLTEDEQQIVNILADREGHAEQGTLVIITGFSKAHLSRLLDELQRRRIIHKEKKGKKNVIWLKSQF